MTLFLYIAVELFVKRMFCKKHFTFYKGSLWATTPTAQRKIVVDFAILRYGSRRATAFEKEVVLRHISFTAGDS